MRPIHSIRQVFQIGFAAIGLTLVIAGVLVFDGMSEILEAERNAAQLRQINTAAMGLQGLANESNVLEARRDIQWKAGVARIRKHVAQVDLGADGQHLMHLMNRQLDDAETIRKTLQRGHLPEQAALYDIALTGRIRTMTGMSEGMLNIARLQRTEAIERMGEVLLLAVLMLLGVMGLVSAYVYRLILRPVDQLTRGISALGRGELAVRIAHVGTRELQAVADAVNAMAEELQRSLVSRDALVAEVDERKKAYARLQETQHLLVQAEKLSALGTLVGGVAHEINNPIMGITSYVTYAIGKMEAGRPRDMLERALGEIDRISRIVKNMLLFARTRVGAATDRADIADILDKTLAMLEDDLRRAEVRVSRRIAADIPLARCSEDTLQQTLLNLLLNARDALSGKESQREITVSLGCENKPDQPSSLVLVIMDNGPGVPEDLAERIFDPFFTTKPPGKGTGLGLAVSRQMIEAAGGSIALTTRSPLGARFEIRCPLAQQEAPPQGEKHE